MQPDAEAVARAPPRPTSQGSDARHRSALQRPSKARARNSSAASTWRPAPPPRSSPCAATCSHAARSDASRRSTRPDASAGVVVQPRLPRAAPHRLADAGRDPGEDHRLRGRARDPGLGRPAPPPRSGGPALLCLLPSLAGRRAADLRRGGADAAASPSSIQPCCSEAPKNGEPGEQADHGGVLLDLQLPGRPARHLLRQLPDQAGGRGPAERAREPEDLRHAVTGAEFRRAGLVRCSADTDTNLVTPSERQRLAVLSDPDWAHTSRSQEPSSPLLLRLAAHYFLRGKTGDGRPLDPVARFHLGNGARLERINWQGDISPKGLREAHGLMCNYRYEVKDIEKQPRGLRERGRRCRLAPGARPAEDRAGRPEAASSCRCGLSPGGWPEQRLTSYGCSRSERSALANTEGECGRFEHLG